MLRLHSCARIWEEFVSYLITKKEEDLNAKP